MSFGQSEVISWRPFQIPRPSSTPSPRLGYAYTRIFACPRLCCYHQKTPSSFCRRRLDTNLQAGGRRPRRNAELSFLPKSPAGESAWRNRNGKFLAKWLPGCDRSLRARFASHLRNKFAMRLVGLFRFTQGSKGFRRKETTCSGAGQRSSRMANSPRLTVERISRQSPQKSAERPKGCSTSPRGAASNSTR